MLAASRRSNLDYLSRWLAKARFVCERVVQGGAPGQCRIALAAPGAVLDRVGPGAFVTSLLLVAWGSGMCPFQSPTSPMVCSLPHRPQSDFHTPMTSPYLMGPEEN
jgi:hypothetical protein